jgi:predicted nucleic acid-binding protein
MSKMHPTIISDTSCLIILSNIDELDLLQKIYSKIITTKEVATEFRQELPDWIELRSASNIHYQQILELQIDKGEASAIALAIEIPESIIILDDFKARRVAQNLGIEFTGTLGVIITAKLKGIISSISPLV